MFFGGFTETGARRRPEGDGRRRARRRPVRELGRDLGGTGADEGSFLQLAGPAAAGSYYSHATFAPPKADFVERYVARFGAEPDEYTASAYACAQVIVDGTARRGRRPVRAPTRLREAVRAYAVDPTHRYETVIGNLGFDANGDSLQQFVTFYRVDPSAAGGKGDWVIAKQQDYGPAP